MSKISDSLGLLLDHLVEASKTNNIKRVSIYEAWKLLQLATADVITCIEKNSDNNLDGKSKKELALLYLEKFYDGVFVIIGIPFVPNLIEPIIHRYVKKILMTLVSSTIDALVETFKRTGFFTTKDDDNKTLDSQPKVSDK